MTTYRMPAEWEPHERCWMAWPSREGMWEDPEATRRAYARVAHAIAPYEPVTMLAPPHFAATARHHLGSDVDVLEVPIDDSWCRDSGPTFVRRDDGTLAGVCFTFNAWGGKYHPHDQDALMAERILDALDVPVIHSALVAEGGGVCVDGEGTLLTDSCFPNANRNPHWSREAIDEELRARLGVEQVIWLPGDPLDQETDGHIDCVAAFAAPGKVIVAATDDAADPRAPYFDALHAALSGATDRSGRPFELLPLPEATLERRVSQRFCPSYVNFYLANGAVIAPAYGIPTDDAVSELLGHYFPDREVNMVAIDAIAEGGGGIHCITQQQPALTKQ
ncbi:MAG: agmatine deiminase family protein [Pseudomonadota bacterium]